ncbi:unnamed protein product [Triticum turgidum subsp. durum]|uniref:PUM-HD domain-containing protein n=1 Tax=Triticum turgidum subsp. durum TaxID=4567 RepID=A0A9R0YZ61_TRITD|nr:unnamed protein product [Triticum turgidum subsp. durum]
MAAEAAPLPRSLACTAAAALPPPSRAPAPPSARSSPPRPRPTSTAAASAAPPTCSPRRRFCLTRRTCSTTTTTSTSTRGCPCRWCPRRTGARRSGSRLPPGASGTGGGGPRRPLAGALSSRCSQGHAKATEWTISSMIGWAEVKGMASHVSSRRSGSAKQLMGLLGCLMSMASPPVARALRMPCRKILAVLLLKLLIFHALIAGMLLRAQIFHALIAGMLLRLSRSNSRNAFESPNPVRSSESSKAQLQSRSESMNGFRSGSASPSLVRVQSLGSSMSHTFASAVGSSISRSTTPDPQLMQRAPSPCLPPVGVRMGKADKMVEGRNVASRNHDGSDTAAALSAMSSLNLSGNNMANLESDVQNHIYQNFGGDQRDVLFNNVPKEHRQFSPHNLVHNADEEPINALEYAVFPNGSSHLSNLNMSKLAAESNSKFPTQSQHGNGHKKGSLLSPTGPVYLYQNLNGDSSNTDVPGRHAKANSRSPGSSMLNNHLNTDGEYANLLSSQRGTGYQVQPMDAVYAPYLQANPNSPLGAAGSMSPFRGSNFSGSGHMDNAAYQKAYLASLLAQQKLQYGMPYMGKSGGLSPTLYGSEQAYGMDMAYLSSPTSSHFIPSPQGHARQGDRLTRIPSMARSTTGGTMGTWSSENGLIDNAYESTLLEEFKTNKTRSFELLDIVGHVVEFSSDQHGSRFIQQKLETASTEEKNMIFPEILPQARMLMTDVFGNYVIQKFFEYGTEPQQKQLANLLKGHVYTLSTQMYGCRVVQKALEVVGVEQQTQMALELDGNTIILKLVRDQNGNHVIQKCIECIPQERIQFIVSAFYGQVVELSTHPYGCRVIQRVLEHCDDESTQNAMMEEIMQCVVPLTQDQYGNYVIQHVLQHGKPEERTSIIKQLAGQIVKMSQQKFASNVVEKCLSFGSPEERQILINEMLGTTDENEPLQAMMKDQFANYVVQKVLETCDDHNRELILSRIKVHLNALKRYTYGKHIVARVEKLIAAGERRIGVSSQSCRD